MKKLANIAAGNIACTKNRNLLTNCLLSILDREDALKKAEKILEDDASRFDAFLKENNIKTMEATKRYQRMRMNYSNHKIQ